eukprot:TRINITY_DN31952_c0_g1_i1.p1 TRINITY_DN31952_c0_g1~~TRINITY_DN31952_c0_g1_i1.p1  ORF type:complete len:1063 (+),score=235.29 TRINITY_DN31952_c0_g1_i1:93-3281(+)
MSTARMAAEQRYAAPDRLDGQEPRTAPTLSLQLQPVGLGAPAERSCRSEEPISGLSGTDTLVRQTGPYSPRAPRNNTSYSGSGLSPGRLSARQSSESLAEQESEPGSMMSGSQRTRDLAGSDAFMLPPPPHPPPRNGSAPETSPSFGTRRASFAGIPPSQSVLGRRGLGGSATAALARLSLPNAANQPPGDDRASEKSAQQKDTVSQSGASSGAKTPPCGTPSNGGLPSAQSMADRFAILNAPQAPPRVRARTSNKTASLGGDSGPNTPTLVTSPQLDEEYNPDLWDAHQKVAHMIGSVNRLLPDSRFRRVWDLMQLAVCSVALLLAPLVACGSLPFAPACHPVMWVLTLLFALDIVVRLNTALLDGDEVLDIDPATQRWMNFRRWGPYDILSTFPADCITYLSGAPEMAVRALTVLRFVRLYHVKHMFTMSNSGAIDPGYVRFYFNLAPRVKFIFGCALVLHVLTCVKLSLADDDPDNYQDNKWDDRYDHCLFWIWNLLTTSPAPLTLNSYGQRVFCFMMMWFGVVFQGIVVGQVSVWMLQSSIREQNKDKMRTTLDIVTHYNLPGPLQQEVLSFQWHALQSNLNFLSNAGQVLERLPALMRNEVNLYAKIAFINTQPMFSHARHDSRVRLASSLKGFQLEPGEKVIVEGRRGDAMYFILHGFCDVVVRGTSVAVLKRGQFFGEVSLLSDTPRTATVVTLTYCDFFVLSRTDFTAICQDDSIFLGEIRASMRDKIRKGLAALNIVQESPEGGHDADFGGMVRQLTADADMLSAGRSSSGGRLSAEQAQSHSSASSSRSSGSVERRKERLVAELAHRTLKEKRKEDAVVGKLLERARRQRERSRESAARLPARRVSRGGGGKVAQSMEACASMARSSVASATGSRSARGDSRPALQSLRLERVRPPRESRSTPRSGLQTGSPRAAGYRSPESAPGLESSVAMSPRGAALEALTSDDKLQMVVESVRGLQRTSDAINFELRAVRDELASMRQTHGEQLTVLSGAVGDLQSDVFVVQELTEVLVEQQMKSATQDDPLKPSQQKPRLLGEGYGTSASFRTFASLF